MENLQRMFTDLYTATRKACSLSIPWCDQSNEDDWHIISDCNDSKQAIQVSGLEHILLPRLQQYNNAGELIHSICAADNDQLAGTSWEEGSYSIVEGESTALNLLYAVQEVARRGFVHYRVQFKKRGKFYSSSARWHS
ncbi:hypothetical protein TSUD_136980 [Trifolium subterraneum]|uniref:Uncharacterized protein n=1 Tax=Trifolium subterraneum TaxID=3900 RepID=A0A2Z6NZF2_TRISU|nr:hypothetical protein TSUD_136980 [Trifolium subterraneum]